MCDISTMFMALSAAAGMSDISQARRTAKARKKLSAKANADAAEERRDADLALRDERYRAYGTQARADWHPGFFGSLDLQRSFFQP